MLINKGITVGEIITLKLTSGEEVLAKLIDRTAMSIRVSKPMVLTMGAQGIGMIPYLITADPAGEIELSSGAIVVMAATEKGPADQYIQSVTGIKMI